MKKSTKKHMTLKEFEDIQKLVSVGVKTRIIAEITGRSNTTIHAVKKSKSLESYRQARQAAKKKYLTPKATSPKEVRQVDKAVSDHHMNQVLQNINDSLVNIDQRLKFIEEHMKIPARSKLKLWH